MEALVDLTFEALALWESGFPDRLYTLLLNCAQK